MFRFLIDSLLKSGLYYLIRALALFHFNSRYTPVKTFLGSYFSFPKGLFWLIGSSIEMTIYLENRRFSTFENWSLRFFEIPIVDYPNVNIWFMLDRPIRKKMKNVKQASTMNHHRRFFFSNLIYDYFRST